ncbi:MAG: DUF5119 domain-containing protein [Muribaculaceae bacterium]|nr:DUF5119 domain-containing protein [Muribaculaceae bacterium]
MTKRLSKYLLLILPVVFASCRHKDLFTDSAGQVDVVFDWRNAPDADPASMVTQFFGEPGTASLRFILQGKDGGTITLPLGSYSAISVNGDDNDWVRLRNVDDIENYETYSIDAQNTQAYGLSSRALPRAEGTENERMAQAPGMLYTNRQDKIEHYAYGTETITFYPEEAVCHYTVDISDVSNLEYVNRAEIDGTISGMAEGFNHGAKLPTDTHVTMPFILSADAKEKTLHSEFLTFGESPHDSGKHILSVYLFLTDGTKWYYNFDVTDQVHTAPDPHHVHIVLSDLSVPHPITDEGGFKPNVNDWQTEEIDLNM